MNPDRWTTTRNVFRDALAMETAGRSSFLASRCDGDSALRREVERLLEADARTGDGAFLSDVIAAVARDLVTPASPTDHAGPGDEAPTRPDRPPSAGPASREPPPGR